MEVAIVGSGIASKTAAETLLSGLQDGDRLTIITPEECRFYSRVFLPEYIAGEISRSELMLDGANEMHGGRIRFVRGRVVRVDTAGRFVELEDGTAVRYDKLLIASGASPRRLGIGKPGLPIFCLRDLEDAERIKDAARRARRCTVVGGGLVSLKAAGALSALGKKVTVLVGSDKLLSLVSDRVTSQIIQGVLETRGIRFRFNTEVRELERERGGGTRAILADSPSVEGDMVVIAKGVRPNLECVEGAGIETDRGILVDEWMRTSAEDVYAAGDVAQSADLLNDRRSLFTLWPTAALQGRVAGSNILGREKRFCGGLSMNSVVFARIPFVFLGMARERDVDGCQVHSRHNPVSGSYRKVVIRNNRLVGAILAGNIDYAGMLYWDIRSGREIEDPESYLNLEGLTRLALSRSGGVGAAEPTGARA